MTRRRPRHERSRRGDGRVARGGQRRIYERASCDDPGRRHAGPRMAVHPRGGSPQRVSTRRCGSRSTAGLAGHDRLQLRARSDGPRRVWAQLRARDDRRRAVGKDVLPRRHAAVSRPALCRFPPARRECRRRARRSTAWIRCCSSSTRSTRFRARPVASRSRTCGWRDDENRPGQRIREWCSYSAVFVALRDVPDDRRDAGREQRAGEAEDDQRRAHRGVP